MLAQVCRESLELGGWGVNDVGKGHRVGRGAPKACEECVLLLWAGLGRRPFAIHLDYLRHFFRDKKIIL